MLDQEGIDAVSMRRVGDELGTGAASLYWHVGNKDELIDMVLDRVIGELEIPELDPARWQEQLKELAREARRVMKRHRDIARRILGRMPTGPNMVRVSEATLAILRAGLPDRVAALAGDMVALYIGAYVFEESLSLPPPGAEDSTSRQTLELIAAYYASLPTDHFPSIVALTRAGYLMAGDADERFEFGIDVLIRGLSTMGHEG